MHLAFDIFQGIGIAVALGIRPFLPAVVAGGLAAAGLQIHFDHTDYAFLQSLPMEFVLVVAAVALLSVERGLSDAALRRRPVLVGLGLVTAALGGLLFAGALARDHHPAWPGLVGGVLCVAVSAAATQPLLARVRARLGAEGTSTLPALAELAAGLLAALSIIAPPVGVAALLLAAWLLLAGRGRAQQKYAGLRILR